MRGYAISLRWQTVAPFALGCLEVLDPLIAHLAVCSWLYLPLLIDQESKRPKGKGSLEREKSTGMAEEEWTRLCRRIGKPYPIRRLMLRADKAATAGTTLFRWRITHTKVAAILVHQMQAGVPALLR